MKARQSKAAKEILSNRETGRALLKSIHSDDDVHKPIKCHMIKFQTTLVKAKIVLEDEGKSLVLYLWKPTFLWFGYWYPYGSSSGSGFSTERLNKINDRVVSKILFDNFIRGL